VPLIPERPVEIGAVVAQRAENLQREARRHGTACSPGSSDLLALNVPNAFGIRHRDDAIRNRAIAFGHATSVAVGRHRGLGVDDVNATPTR